METRVKQYDPSQVLNLEATTNPITQGFNIIVSIPETVEIKMVNASVLSDYELWIYISTLISDVAIGFWVSYCQNTIDLLNKILLWISVLFSIFFVLSLVTTFFKRSKLNRKAKNIKLKTSGLADEQEK